MAGITFLRTYYLHEDYEAIKESAYKYLSEYLLNSNLFLFNDFDKSLSFSTERLIPTHSKHRHRVMLLFSNPHPYSVHQGMFLSPNKLGVENAFWPVMINAGWLPKTEKVLNPKQLADLYLKAKYPGPFELIFYCYYAFPTDDPEDIRRIFGEKYFKQVIHPEAMDEFRRTVEKTSVKAIVTFNKGIFNLVSSDHIDTYIMRLEKGELIQSQIKGIDKSIPSFLTFPTGWWRSPQRLRTASLKAIWSTICSQLDVTGGKDR